MNEKQAIGMLKHYINAWKGKFTGKHFEACELAIKALEKAEKIHKKIDKNLRETDDLIAAAKDKRITAGEFSKRYSRLQSQWTDLDNELRSIERRLYDELES